MFEHLCRFDSGSYSNQSFGHMHGSGHIGLGLTHSNGYSLADSWYCCRSNFYDEIERHQCRTHDLLQSFAHLDDRMNEEVAQEVYDWIITNAIAGSDCLD